MARAAEHTNHFNRLRPEKDENDENVPKPVPKHLF